MKRFPGWVNGLIIGVFGLTVMAASFNQDRVTWRQHGQCLTETHNERSIVHHGFTTHRTNKMWVDPDGHLSAIHLKDGSLSLAWQCVGGAVVPEPEGEQS